MPKRTLICGSLAYDTIMVFPDRFARHILPEQTHVLSVSFQITEMRREWGGCAGNIAYNLKALGGEPVVMATIGADGAAYRERLEGLGIAIDGVRTLPQMFTAQLGAWNACAALKIRTLEVALRRYRCAAELFLIKTR